MAVEPSELEELRDALIRARARGTREVQHGEERIRYGSDREMVAAIGDLEARIARASGTRRTRVAFSTSKGV